MTQNRTSRECKCPHLFMRAYGGSLATAKVISCRWIKDIEAYTPGSKVEYPIISDPKREIAVL